MEDRRCGPQVRRGAVAGAQEATRGSSRCSLSMIWRTHRVGRTPWRATGLASSRSICVAHTDDSNWPMIRYLRGLMVASTARG